MAIIDDIRVDHMRRSQNPVEAQTVEVVDSALIVSVQEFIDILGRKDAQGGVYLHTIHSTGQMPSEQNKLRQSIRDMVKAAHLETPKWL